MEEVKNFIYALALDIQQILDRVDVVLVPLEFQSFFPSIESKAHGALGLSSFDWLEHLSVKQVIDFFVVELQEGNLNRHPAVVRSFRQAFHKLTSTTLHQADLVRCHCRFDLGLILPFVIHNVLIAFHCIRLTSSSLSVREEGGVITVDNLADHWFHSDCLIE